MKANPEAADDIKQAWINDTYVGNMLAPAYRCDKDANPDDKEFDGMKTELMTTILEKIRDESGTLDTPWSAQFIAQVTFAPLLHPYNPTVPTADKCHYTQE